MSPRAVLAYDKAQQYLEWHLGRTEELMLATLRTMDPDASAAITAAADLCLPHDVIRIAGGFATGCVVQWRCSTPVIPVDTTVNIDTSSLFWLDSVPDLDHGDFEALRERIENDSSYEWNFHKGNHFISIVESTSDGRPAMVIHSNEKEFKYQFNGLMPVEGNWFMDEVETFRRGDHYIRLLIGDRAKLFREIAKLMEPFNVARHRFVADVLLRGKAKVLSDYHKHHYYMPTEESVAIGCFLCDPGEVVPIFSRAGSEIHLFEPRDGGSNSIDVPGLGKKLVVPHGWGKTMATDISIVYDESLFTINGQSYEVRPLASLGTHPDLIVRQFAETPEHPESIYSRMQHHTPGTVVERLRQKASYSRLGYVRHD